MSNTKVIAEKLQQLTFREIFEIGRYLNNFAGDNDPGELNEVEFVFCLLGWSESELEADND